MDGHTAQALGRLLTPWPTLPSYLLLFVTSRCEAACRHCFFWRRSNRAEAELSLEEIETLLASLSPLVQLTITGGSPELRDDLGSILLATQTHCKPLNVTLCSNGNHPDRLEAALNQLFELYPDAAITMDISLDAIGEEHDKLRNLPGLFERTVESFRRVARSRDHAPNLRLGCGICISGVNSETALHTVDWALKNLELDNLTPVLVRGTPRDPQASGRHTGVFLEVAHRVRQGLEVGELRGYARFPTLVNAKDLVQKELIEHIATTGKMPIRCSALHETAVVYPDGTVPVCELLDDSLGNLRDVNMNFRALWFGHEAKLLRKVQKSRRCVCWHQCFLSASMIKSPSIWPKLAHESIRLATGRNGDG